MVFKKTCFDSSRSSVFSCNVMRLVVYTVLAWWLLSVRTGHKTESHHYIIEKILTMIYSGRNVVLKTNYCCYNYPIYIIIIIM